MMKTYQQQDFVAIENVEALKVANCVTKAVLKEGFKTIEVAKDDNGNIRQVKMVVRDSNIIKKLFLANIDQTARTLTQDKTKEIMAYFEGHQGERSATFTEVFKANGQEKTITFIVTYHGNGYKDHRNYSCEVVNTEIVNAYTFLD